MSPENGGTVRFQVSLPVSAAAALLVYQQQGV